MNKALLATLSAVATSIAWAAALYLAGPPVPAVHAAPAPAGLAPAATPQGRGLRASSGETPTDAEDLNVRVTPVVKAVRRSSDSVVSIYVTHRARLSRAGEVPADGQGSGVILDASGLVITNWHVIAQAAANPATFVVEARLKNDKRYPAKVISVSAADDLGLLRLDVPAGDTLKPITLGDSSSLMIGETVVAIGNPSGHANTVTVGVLSAENRGITVRTPDGRMRRYSGLLQTDAAINQGNSGGALLDITGKLIGINNAMAVGVENIGFAIPVNTVRRVFRDTLLSSENIASVWFGMQVRDVDGDVVITEVSPDGPADRAGARRGDRVVGVGGSRIESWIDYARRIVDAEPGRPLAVDVERGGRTRTLRPVPLSAAGRELVARIGIEVDTVTPEQDRELVRKATTELVGGRSRRLLRSIVRIRQVYPGSPAATIGLRAGDVLLSVRRRVWGGLESIPLISEQDLADTARGYAGRWMFVSVLREGEVLEGDLPVR